MLHIMKQWFVVSLIITAILLLGISSSAQAAPQATLQVIQFRDILTEEPTPGAALLNRTRNHLRVTAHVSGLDANTVYTLWAVIFNNPDACVTHPEPEALCGPPADLFADPNVAQSSIVHVAGFITDGSGNANVVGHLHSGTIPDGTDVLVGTGGILDNGVKPGLFPGKGFKAEVHFVVRTHGSIDLERITEQLSTFEFDCPMEICSDRLIARFPRLQN